VSGAVWAVAVALLAGAILQVCEVSAGNGRVVDWRTIRSGEILVEGADAFDVAYLFVGLIGEEAALALLGDDAVKPPAPPAEPIRVHAFMTQANGGRRRTFDVGPFRVTVDPCEDDAGQAAFTERLAILAHREMNGGAS